MSSEHRTWPNKSSNRIEIEKHGILMGEPRLFVFSS